MLSKKPSANNQDNNNRTRGSGANSIFRKTMLQSTDCLNPNEVELWGMCYNIEETTSLNLSNSDLTGQIPPEICNLTNLKWLYLYDNQLTGEIPSCIGNLIWLRVLSLHSNQLTGSIPESIGNLQHIYHLSLHTNQLTGEIPKTFGNLAGDIMDDLGQYLQLRLSHNQLSGQIPESFCNLYPDILPMADLNYLKLYDNNLCPPYPWCLAEEVGYDIPWWDYSSWLPQNTSTCPNPDNTQHMWKECKIDRDCEKNQICVAGVCRSMSMLQPINSL
jgi:hypothetical protein